MSKRVQEYLQSKDYNILAERLIYMLDEDFTKENFEKGEISEIFGNWASAMVYPFSNEYLDELFKEIDIKDGRALVVGSSGDQGLHAVDKGAREVTVLDSNMWAIPFIELKLSAIKNLGFTDFSKYICNGDVFNHKYYAKVSHDLSAQSKAFWDEIILNCPQTVLIKAREVFMHNALEGQDIQYGTTFHSYYNNEEAYNSIKEKIKHATINVEYASLEDFPEVADGKYDLIMLSNIFDYVKQNDFFPVVKALNDRNLTDDGIIQVYSNLGAMGRTKFQNGNIFVKGVLRFFSRCETEDIKIKYHKEFLLGSKIKNWLAGNRAQGHFLMKKSNLDGVNPILEGIEKE